MYYSHHAESAFVYMYGLVGQQTFGVFMSAAFHFEGVLLLCMLVHCHCYWELSCRYCYQVHLRCFC